MIVGVGVGGAVKIGNTGKLNQASIASSYFNAIQQRGRGAEAPAWFQARYAATMLRLERGVRDIPADLTDEFVMALYPSGLTMAANECDMFAAALTVVNHVGIIDLLIEPSLAWLQAHYYKAWGSYSRLMTPMTWRQRVEPKINPAVRGFYRRNADLMLVAEAVGCFYGLTASVAENFADLEFRDEVENWRELAGQVDSMADALTTVDRCIRVANSLE